MLCFGMGVGSLPGFWAQIVVWILCMCVRVSLSILLVQTLVVELGWLNMFCGVGRGAECCPSMSGMGRRSESLCSCEVNPQGTAQTL